MDRRGFLKSCGAAAVTVLGSGVAWAANHDRNLLILVELKGGNDGLNTVVPFADPAYYRLRPQLAVPRERVLRLDDRTGLHPALVPLAEPWRAGELAIVESVGYPRANLSHFRSIEIWDTASRSDQYLTEGWLARTLALAPVPQKFAADAVVIGGNDLGPFSGRGIRAVALSDTDGFVRRAKLAHPGSATQNPALSHILKVEGDIVQAAQGLAAARDLQTEFPRTPFGNALRTAARVAANPAGAAAIKVSLNGFDTHSNQAAVHERLLATLAEGLLALRAALKEIGRWDRTLIVTYAEFGRRAAENRSGGTDHGTASTHFALGGRVRGGVYGLPPALDRLDSNGNLPFAVDFRDFYATVLERWWDMDPVPVLGGAFRPLDFIRV